MAKRPTIGLKCCPSDLNDNGDLLSNDRSLSKCQTQYTETVKRTGMIILMDSV